MMRVYSVDDLHKTKDEDNADPSYMTHSLPGLRSARCMLGKNADDLNSTSKETRTLKRPAKRFQIADAGIDLRENHNVMKFKVVSLKF
jgi:hypothetical protein